MILAKLGLLFYSTGFTIVLWLRPYNFYSTGHRSRSLPGRWCMEEPQQTWTHLLALDGWAGTEEQRAAGCKKGGRWGGRKPSGLCRSAVNLISFSRPFIHLGDTAQNCSQYKIINALSYLVLVRFYAVLPRYILYGSSFYARKLASYHHMLRKPFFKMDR